MTDNTPIAVTQADRDAAADYVSVAFGERYRKSVQNEGRWPDLVQAFAQHRHRTQPTPSRADDGLVERLARAKEIADELVSESLFVEGVQQPADVVGAMRHIALNAAARGYQAALRASGPVHPTLSAHFESSANGGSLKAAELVTVELRAARAAGNIPSSKTEPVGERAAVVVWLRGQAAIYNDQNPDLSALPEWTLAQKWANAIERGDHLTKPEPGK